MRSVTVTILCACFALAPASEQDAMDMLADKVASKLIDRAMSLTASDADMDDTTLGKSSTLAAAQPMASSRVASSAFAPPLLRQCRSSTLSVNAMMNDLKKYGVRSDPMQELALTALVGTRDVCAQAQTNKMFSSMGPAAQTDVMKRSKTAVSVVAKAGKVSDMAGATAPFAKSGSFWDPVGFSTQTEEGLVLFYREAELKHGRVAMLATLGIAVQDKFHPFIGDMPYEGFVQAHKLQVVAGTFWPALFIACGAIELSSGSPWDLAEGKLDRAPGDLGYDPLGLKPKDPAGLKEMQSKELNNGRLAMFAAMGLMFQEIAGQIKGANFVSP
eukprot:gnl/TRDRNA2_/TRDRNA2_177170_c0_seq4.p1 gnl/TRDRNA2_/TRDRNA2_177170_c0~~gnl/TRDRNA2_/TRDRNA2_177170_c0_seq4.p1  ORF type:complete len:330 (+),score=85.54 gnl/TRDRNA2_/TRDRNA2_177170_c0_seq4:100-1089(+)